jgi:general stress protein 26
MKDEILQFLNQRDFCVVSSVNSAGKPESAFVAYSSNDKLEFIIGTSSQSRKFKNISANPVVSVVVADLSGEVQYEGIVNEVFDTNSDENLISGHFAKLPGSKKYRQDPTQRWIKIKPTWLRYIKHGEEDIVKEITEFA